MKKVEKFELEFLKKEKMARNTYSFYFDRVHVKRGLGKRGFAGYFNFKPGQYIKIYLPISNPDERGTSRYFTISSSPTDKDFLTITTRIIRSSFKLTLNSLRPGQKISAFGPLGYFDFDPKSKKQKVFLAGGIGITPFHSILRYIDHKKLDLPIVLFVSFPFKEEAIFFDELKKIESEKPNIKTVYTLTKEENYYPEFEKGRMGSNMIKKYVQNYKNSEFFVVGPEAFESSMLGILNKMGILKNQIFNENFPGY
ncbi:MAG: FAD-dependent oxidoreductase [Candidatus Levybacteria bacterium]|nr:FAD-dependent oxidoreductase [Candidatus Levybacteria bacterium]